MLNYLLIYVAQLLGKPNELGIPDKQASNSTLGNILNVVYLIAGAISVLMIVIAGISYTTSSGDATKLTKAKNTIIFSVAGLVIIVSAFAITNTVLGGLK